MERRRLLAAVKRAVEFEFDADDKRNKLLEFIDHLSDELQEDLETSLGKITRKCAHMFNTEVHAFLEIEKIYFPLPGQTLPDGLPSRQTQAAANIRLHPNITLLGELHVIEVQIGPQAFLLVSIGRNEQSSDPTYVQFLLHLGNQLRSLYTTVAYRTAAEKERRAVESLLGTNLHPPELWNEFLSALVDYIPSWCPGFGQASVVQLLITKRQDGTLHLVAGNGANNATTYILISDSVTGMAVSKGWTGPTLLQTNKHRDSYIGYTKTSVRFELVVPIIFEGETIAVLNLESNDRDHFNPLFASFCSEAADFAAPLLKAALDRIATFRTTESRIYYVVSDVLKRLSDTFGHAISQPTTVALLSADDLRIELNSDAPDFDLMKALAQRVLANIKDIRESCQVFARGFPDLLHIGPQDVSSALVRRLGPLRKLAKPYGIDVNFNISDGQMTAFGSSLFVEHVFNICYNSYQQLHEKQRTEKQFRGRITVSIRRKKSIAPSGKDVGVDFIEVTVVDNGGGIQEDILERMKSGPVTTKIGGNGYAIPAAAEFFSSIGGSMVFRNYRGGLRTEFLLQEYDETRHKSAKLGQTSEKGGEGK